MVWKEFHGSCLFSTTFKSFTQKQKQFLQMLWRSNGHKFSLPHAIKNRTSILLSPVLIHWHWSRLKKIVPKNASDGSSFLIQCQDSLWHCWGKQQLLNWLSSLVGKAGKEGDFWFAISAISHVVKENHRQITWYPREGMGARGCWNHQEFSPSQVPQPTLVSLD